MRGMGATGLGVPPPELNLEQAQPLISRGSALLFQKILLEQSIRWLPLSILSVLFFVYIFERRQRGPKSV
jgi:hypothetical protein